LIFAGLFALVVAVIGLIKQRVRWTHVIATRRDAGLLLAGALTLVVVGGAISPQPAKVAKTTSPVTATPSATGTPTAAPEPTVMPTPTSTPIFSTDASGVLLPNRSLTPGSAFAAATTQQICVSGYSKSVRDVSDSARRAVFAAYALDYAGHDKYELDHLVPLELGGDNTALNLWPQTRTGSGAADVKDHLENHLYDLVCSGQTQLAEAQQAIRGDWWTANAKYGAISVVSRPTEQAVPRPRPVPTQHAPAPVQQPAPLAPAPAQTDSGSTGSSGTGASGPTALCNDGSNSYAAHHQGACSHHGGVAQFYN
jgi:hypothetical protein